MVMSAMATAAGAGGNESDSELSLILFRQPEPALRLPTGRSGRFVCAPVLPFKTAALIANVC